MTTTTSTKIDVISSRLKEQIAIDDLLHNKKPELLSIPLYDPSTHYLELTKSEYFKVLIALRHYVKAASDYYFGEYVGAKNVDLFMLTPSISSPMGPGSDSKPLPIEFGDFRSNLVDSSQFGFEPLLLNGLDKVYCYLPSMRGEDPDARHLNQFFHCEAEIKGTMDELIPIIERYIKVLSSTLLTMPHTLKKLSRNYQESIANLEAIINEEGFREISFDDAVDLLIANGSKNLINFTEFGRDISSKGELELARLLDAKTPFWIRNFDRDRVPFYQKPDPSNPNKVVNADLIFPPIINGSFGGEIVGCGQRQDNTKEILESLSRQNVTAEPYEWYIELRRIPNYQITSGFGLGIERFISWSLGLDNIRDSILYPRLINMKTLP